MREGARRPDGPSGAARLTTTLLITRGATGPRTGAAPGGFELGLAQGLDGLTAANRPDREAQPRKMWGSGSVIPAEPVPFARKTAPFMQRIEGFLGRIRPDRTANRLDSAE